MKVYKSVGRHDLTTRMLNSLAMNAVVENRFEDAASYYWTLATENLMMVVNAKQPNIEDIEHLEKFHKLSDMADIYAAYGKIIDYI